MYLFAIKLWNFFRGYAIIKVEGLSIEKFLNLIISKDIYIWDVKRIGYTTIIAKVSLKGFKMIQPYVKITNCRVSIVEKKGFPFIVLYLKRRKMLVIGALSCIILVYIFSTFIWTIDVESSGKNINKEIVLQNLSKLGLKPGVSRFVIDVHKIESQFLVNMNEISWIGIDIKGTKAFVKVVEKTKPPAMLPKDVACNIVAKKDGIISKMTILEGDSVKKIGDTVKAGDIIVSGIIERPNTKTRLVHANAQIIARTWYEGYADVNLNKVEYKRTGKSISVTKIMLGGNTITISPKKVDFKHYDKEIKFITSEGSPVKIIKEIYYETKPQSIILSRRDAEALAIKKALENIKTVLSNDAKIVDKKESVIILDGKTVRADVTVEVLEDIGIEEKISYIQEEKIDQRSNN